MLFHRCLVLISARIVLSSCLPPLIPATATPSRKLLALHAETSYVLGQENQFSRSHSVVSLNLLTFQLCANEVIISYHRRVVLVNGLSNEKPNDLYWVIGYNWDGLIFFALLVWYYTYFQFVVADDSTVRHNLIRPYLVFSVVATTTH